MAIRSAKAVWNGSLKEGNGTLSSQTGAVNGQYSFTSRFEEGIGTNPEELLAAAHAACFSMALSSSLGKAGLNPQKVETEDKVFLEKGESGFSITKIEIHTKVTVAGIDEAAFQQIAEDTKKGCPVSRAITGTVFELFATLQQP